MIRLKLSSSAFKFASEVNAGEILAVNASFSSSALTMAGGVIGRVSFGGEGLEKELKVKGYDVADIVADAKALRFLKISEVLDKIATEYGVIGAQVASVDCPGRR